MGGGAEVPEGGNGGDYEEQVFYERVAIRAERKRPLPRLHQLDDCCSTVECCHHPSFDEHREKTERGKGEGKGVGEGREGRRRRNLISGDTSLAFFCRRVNFSPLIKTQTNLSLTLF